MRCVPYCEALWILACWTGALWAAQPTGQTRPWSVRRDYGQLKEILTRQDSAALGNTAPYPSYDDVGPSERNEIALMLAKGLSIRPLLESLPDQGWRQATTEQEWCAFWREFPPSGPLGMRMSLNITAANHLCYMAERGLLGEAKVIPLLIEALTHPSLVVRQPVFDCLQRLTGHTTGYGCFTTEGDASARAKAVSWWRQWWRANQDKRPVVDAALAADVGRRVMGVARTIERDVKPHYAELSMFRVPDVPEKAPAGLPSIHHRIEYSPRWLALPLRSALVSVPRERLPWLLVLSDFATPEGPDARRAPLFGRELEPPGELRPLVKTIYTEQIPGTDVVVKVQLASPDEGLVRAAEKALHAAPQPPGNRKPGSSPARDH